MPALISSRIFQAGIVLFLARVPEFDNNALCAGRSDCAVRLTGSADSVLPGRAELSASGLALSAIPDLAWCASLLTRCSYAGWRSNCFPGRRGSAGSIFGLQLSGRTRTARSVFAELAVQVRYDRLWLDRVGRLFTRSVCTDSVVRVGLNRGRVILGRCCVYRVGRIELDISPGRLGRSVDNFLTHS